MRRRLGILLSALVLIVFAGGGVILNMDLSSVTDSVQFIYSRLRGDGTFIDYDNSIQVDSVSDIGWWEKNGKWYVMYGAIPLEFTKSQLQNQEFLDMLSEIGLEVYGDVASGSISFTWFGDKVAEWLPK